MVLVEGCVTSVEEAAACAAAGANRLELCRALEVGGLSPDPDLLRRVSSAVPVPVFAMARPRGGTFVFTPEEVAATLETIRALADAGAHGIVLGALTEAGAVDVDATRRMLQAAGSLPVTFHRAFDATPDVHEALETLADLGVARILTSGAASTAQDGTDTLARLVEESRGRVQILAGGGVRGDHVRALVAATGVREVHARAEGIPGVVGALRAEGRDG